MHDVATASALLEAFPGAAYVQFTDSHSGLSNSRWRELTRGLVDHDAEAGLDILLDLLDDDSTETSFRELIQALRAGHLRDASGQVAIHRDPTPHWFRFDIRRMELMGSDALLLTLQDISRLVLAERQHNDRRIAAQRQANTDALTGKASRRAIMVEVRKAWRRWQSKGIPFTVVYADIDGLKQINDKKGHLEGDRVIRTVAGLLGRTLRASDTLGRLGGDEFLIVLPGLTSTDAKAVVERIQHSVIGSNSPAAVSVGYACVTAGDHSADDLIERADKELYSVKPSHIAGRSVI